MASRGSRSRKSLLPRLLQRGSLDIIIVKVGQVSLCFGIKLDIGAGLPGGEEESFVVLRGGAVAGAALGRADLSDPPRTKPPALIGHRPFMVRKDSSIGNLMTQQ